MLCSGKVYYDLLQGARGAWLDARWRCVRLEQLSPFPDDALGKSCSATANAEIVWCQEEPRNMGAWIFVDRRIEKVLAGAGSRREPAALCRPRRGGLAGDRPASSGTTQEQPSSSPTPAGGPDEASTMATEIRVPTLGELVTEATVANWLKQAGDRGRRRRAAASSSRPTR